MEKDKGVEERKRNDGEVEMRISPGQAYGHFVVYKMQSSKTEEKRSRENSVKKKGMVARARLQVNTRRFKNRPKSRFTHEFQNSSYVDGLISFTMLPFGFDGSAFLFRHTTNNKCNKDDNDYVDKLVPLWLSMFKLQEEEKNKQYSVNNRRRNLFNVFVWCLFNFWRNYFTQHYFCYCCCFYGIFLPFNTSVGLYIYLFFFSILFGVLECLITTWCI